MRNRMEKAVVPGEERTHKQFHVIFNLRHKGSGEERIYKIFYTHIHCMYIYLQHFIFSHFMFVLCTIALDYEVCFKNRDSVLYIFKSPLSNIRCNA